MKKIAIILLAIWMAGSALAQEATWLTSLPEAADQAAREEKLLLLDFTGSDWCGWCMRLDAETFSKPEFIDYAGKYLVLVKVDFPRHKPQSDDVTEANRALKEKYGVHGFPTVLVVKPDGTVLWEQSGYSPGGPRLMMNAVNQCRKAAGLSVPAVIAAAPPPRPAAPAAPAAAAPVRRTVPAPPKAGLEPNLQGIIYSASHSSAVLNGDTCEEGDVVDGMRVLKITRDTVTVEFQGQTKVLRTN